MTKLKMGDIVSRYIGSTDPNRKSPDWTHLNFYSVVSISDSDDDNKPIITLRRIPAIGRRQQRHHMADVLNHYIVEYEPE